MRVLYPAAAASAVLADLREAQTEAEANRLPSGFWSDVHTIREPEETFRAAGTALDGVARALSSIMPRIRAFSSGYGGDFSLDPETDAYCYGFGSQLFIKLEVTEGVLDAIWFDAKGTTEDERRALRSALERLDAVEPLVLADYWLDMGGLVSDAAFMDRYFAELEATAARMASPARTAHPGAIRSFLRRWLRWG